MIRMPTLIAQNNREEPGREFILKYEQSMLFLLHQEGILNSEQVKACTKLLETKK
jgi:hypothetical protein